MLSILYLSRAFINWIIIANFILVEDMCMSMRERSSLDILSWESHVVAVLNESWES